MRRANCTRFFVAALTIGVCYCMYSIYWNIDLYIYNLRIRSALSPYDTYIAGRVLIYFSLTVKAATLIFISGVIRLVHLLRKGNQVLFIIW